MHRIEIAGFSKTPVGRYRTDGPSSGQRFREEVLLPAINAGQKVEIVLDGVAGLPPSFLDEAFGGLVRKGHIARESLKGQLLIRYSNPEFARYERAIWAYIDRAKPD